MNERIRELAKQAHRLAVIASNSQPHICAVGSDYFNALEKEKFAELIVEECIDIAHSEGDNVAYLKDYFGVK